MLFSEQPMHVFASCIRGMLIASPGRQLLASDFSAIEARMIAWLAGHEKVESLHVAEALGFRREALSIWTGPLGAAS